MCWSLLQLYERLLLKLTVSLIIYHVIFLYDVILFSTHFPTDFHWRTRDFNAKESFGVEC